MIVQALLMELQFEANNTRKLFNAIPDKVLEYQPNDFNWTIAQLASHISETYNWWDVTLNQDEFKMDIYSYDKGDISSMKNIKAKLEENIASAVKALEGYPDEKMMVPWTMTDKGKELMPPMPRVQVIRSFLMNHLYHHRGELVAYLRAAKHAPIPGIYGASYDDMMARKG